MTVNVQGPDGSDFEFPDGTSEDVISGAISQHYGGPKNPSFFDMPRADRDVAKLSPSIGRIWGAFTDGAKEGWGTDQLGLSDESKQWLASKNVLPKDAKDFTNPMKPFMAFNEGIILPLAAGLDAVKRAPAALYRGLQAAGFQVGEERGFPNLARDLVSIPDAFMGSPHPLGIPRVPLAEPQPFVKPQQIRPIEGSPRGDLARSEAAQTSLPEVDAVLNNPVTRTVIDNPVIDRSHDVPYMAGGSVPMEDPTIYIDRHVPREQTVVRVSDPAKTVKFDPADPWIVHENVEQHTMELLIKGGMSEQEAYRVAHFEYAEKAEQAWYRAHDIDQEAAEREQLSWLPRIQHENPENPPPNLYNKPYPHDSVAGAQHESVTEAQPTPQEIAQAARIIAGRADELATGGFTAFHGSPASFGKFNTETVDVSTDQNLAERYRQGRGEDRGKNYKGADYIKRVSEGDIDTPSVNDLSKLLTKIRKTDQESSGLDEKTYNRLAQLNREIDRGSDAAMAEKDAILAKLPKDLPEPDIPDEGQIRQLRTEFESLEKTTTESPEEYIDGIARVLKRYISDFTSGDDFARAVFRKAFDEAKKHGIDTKKLGNEVIDQLLRDLSPSDQAFMRSEFAKFTAPRLAGPRGKGNLYQVSVGASRDDFLNLDKPLSEQSETVKAALATVGKPSEPSTLERVKSHAVVVGGKTYEANTHLEAYNNALKENGGVDPGGSQRNLFMTNRGRLINQAEAIELSRAELGLDVPAAPQLGMDVWDSLRDAMGADAAAAKLREAGIAGTSREHGVYSVFDPNILQITHVNGQPILDAARDLGVLGPPKVPLTEGKPAEAAARATGGDGGGPQPPQGGGGPSGGEPQQPTGNPWRDRFEHFVGKLETPEDVKQLIRESADEKGEFPVARQGDIPLAHVEAIAEAAGVEPGEVNQRGLGRLLKNDAEVRTAMQLMLQVTENVKAAARDVRADGSPENLIKLQEAIMRRDLAVEQVVGLRAEWGRTGNVFQEFLRDVKDQEGLSNFLKDKGRTPGDLRDIADAVDALDRSQAARVLNDMRTPTAWDKFMWYWVNALISGPVTHAKYVVANAAFAGYESAVVTPVAGVVGAVRRSLLGGNEGVFVGEAAARMWGLVAGTPDAIVAAAKAARTGLQTPLPGEVAQNILPKQNKGLPFQQKPIEGPIGTLVGIPSRGAAGIHSFFNFLGYRASIEAQAYRHAASTDGLSPIAGSFWERRQGVANVPTVEMMNSAIEEGYRLTYINELSPAGKLMSRAIKSTKLGQLVLPFTHIPFNILSRGLEGTPAAFLTEETRADVFGRNGAVKQDMAVARLVAGSAVGAWAVNLVLNDRMTGYGPTDPKERAQWTATGHQPYSIRIGDEWMSFNRFGSLGTMLGLHANLAEAIPHLKSDSEELTKALVMTVHSTGRLLEDEVGMQGLAGLIDAINDPERKGTRFVSAFAGSLLPYSSALRQTASSMDPEMREVKSFVDGLRYYIPGVRQDLLPKRDWLGEPFTNAGYGGDLPIPGVSSIIQHRQAEANPIAEEMKRLDLHPAVPSDRVGGVKLPPKLYDQYQMTAGQFTRQVLSNWVAQPNWYQMPEFARAEVFRRSISAVRQQAGAMMMGMYPQIIQQGVQQRVDQINGVKPTKLKDAQ